MPYIPDQYFYTVTLLIMIVVCYLINRFRLLGPADKIIGKTY